MNLSNYFDVSRFWLLLKLEGFRSRKGLLMTFVITFGMLFWVGLLLGTFIEMPKVYDAHPATYAFSLILGGFVLSSLTFPDLGNNLRRPGYLSLPASTLEKFVCMWLLSSVAWILLFTLAFTAYTWVANPIGQLLFSRVRFEAFDPLGPVAVSSMKYYFVLQGVFLAGATHFRAYVLPKTLFVLILFATLCSVLAYFVMGDLVHVDEAYFADPKALKEMPVYRFWLLAKWLFWWVLAPLCWVISYWGLKEAEV